MTATTDIALDRERVAAGGEPRRPRTGPEPAPRRRARRSWTPFWLLTPAGIVILFDEIPVVSARWPQPPARIVKSLRDFGRGRSLRSQDLSGPVRGRFDSVSG